MFTRQDLITRRLPKVETKVSNTTCVELTNSKKTCCILFAYSPPQNNNFKTFSEEINLPLFTVVNEYDNIMLIGDLTLKTKSKNNSYCTNLCDTFDLTNRIKSNFHWRYINKLAKKFSKIWSNYHRAQWLSQNDFDFLSLLHFQITT